MAYTPRNSSFSAPATVPACHVSPPSVVRTNVPPVPLTQTTLPLTMLNPYRLASVFDFCGCHWAKEGETNNRRTRNALFNCMGGRSCLVSTCLPHITPPYIAVGPMIRDTQGRTSTPHPEWCGLDNNPSTLVACQLQVKTCKKL